MKKVLLAQFTVAPSGAEVVRQLVVEYARAVRAETGNRLFAPTTRVDDPHTYVIFEEYENEAAFALHLSTAHCAAFNAAIAPWIHGGATTLIDLVDLESARSSAAG
ncbi:MAG: (4S)-4-hydroxy-5-phosphonooxypentane-2,3-dione isomerase [Actinomycetota bacterium]